MCPIIAERLHPVVVVIVAVIVAVIVLVITATIATMGGPGLELNRMFG